jgi:hypothetical protein
MLSDFMRNSPSTIITLARFGNGDSASHNGRSSHYFVI